MSKRLLIIFLLLGTAAAQVHHFGALDTNNTWTATNNFTGTFDSSSSLFTRPFRYVTLATIPSSCSANRDAIAVLDAPQGQKIRICNATGTGFEVAGGVSTGIPGQFVVDGISYTTIHAAVLAAGSTGSVLIPSNYAGTDTDPNPNKVQIIDLRGFPNRQRGYINMLTDCGLKGDGVTDDSAAANACLAAYPGTRFYFPPTNFGNNPSYFFAASLTPIGNTTVITGGANGFLNDINKAGSTVLKFAAGITGIDIQSCGCTVEYISLLGSEGTQNMVNPVLLNFPSGANLPLSSRNISSIQRSSNVLTVTISKVSGQEGLTQRVGSTVKIAGVVGDTTMNGLCVVASLSGNSAFGGNPVTFTCPQNGADAGPFGAVGTISLPTTGASAADGIHVCNNFVFILHVTIQSFGRHGINADSLPGHGCNSPFSDDLVVRDSSIIGNQGDGFICDGTDCNAGLLESNAFYYNLLWAVEDQSALGNSYQSNQISNNGVQWTGPSTPATKAISSISRTLTSNSSTVSVVLSVADPFAKLGSCMVIAGVTDSSFNTPANQCFFITSFTDSTHYSYIQPGAPADASSSGGTSRMAKYSEAYLSAGLDSGALKVGTQAAASSPSLYATYTEGGQYCKFGATVLNVGGVGAECGNAPSATSSSDFLGQYIATACPGLGGITCIGAPTLFSYAHDFGGGLYFRSGFTTDATFGFSFLKFNSTVAWGLVADPAGTAGGSGSFNISSQGFGQTRFMLWGKDTNNGHTYLNAEGAGGTVIFGRNWAGTNAGTGGIEVDSGGASPIKVWGVDSSGQITWAQQSVVANKFVSSGTPTGTRTKTWQDTNGTVAELQTAQTFTQNQTFPAVISSTTNPASAGFLRMAKTDSLVIRNNANGADITALSLNGSDQVVLPTLAATSSAVSFTAPAFISSTANPASAGVSRLAKTDVVNFRNNANSGDVNGLSLDGSDRLVVGGAGGIMTSAIPSPGPIGALISSSGTFTTLIANVSVTGTAFISGSSNPAAAGVVRLAKTDAFNFRNNPNSADINGLSLDASDVVQVGGNTNGVRIGSAGAALKKVLTTTSVIDFAAQAANTCTDSAGITLTGALDADSIDVGVPAADWVANVEYSAYVSAADTVKVRLCNNATGASADPASGTFRVTVRQY